MAMRAATLGAAMSMLVGCSDVSDEQGESTSETPSGTSPASDSSSDDSGSTTGGSSSSTSAGVDTGTGTDDAASSSDDGTPTTDPTGEPPPPKLCSLEAVHAGQSGEVMMIDAGDGAGQIPTVVGEVLLRNCGCHYTDDVVPGMYVDYKSNLAPMNTHAEFHALFAGTFPQGYEDMPVYLAVEQRVVHSNPLPMPPFGCGIEDGEPGQRITPEDLELLTQWLAAAAPDGANFP